MSPNVNPLDSAFRHSAKLRNALGNFVNVFAKSVANLIKKFMDADEVGSLDVPMSLFDLKLEIDAVGETLVKQLDHLKTRFFAEVVEGMNECGHNFWMGAISS